MTIKYYVSMTINPETKVKWVFKCDSAKQADIVIAHARRLKYIKSIYRFKHNTANPYKKKGWNIHFYDSTTFPNWYRDFCECCGRDYE